MSNLGRGLAIFGLVIISLAAIAALIIGSIALSNQMNNGSSVYQIRANDSTQAVTAATTTVVLFPKELHFNGNGGCTTASGSGSGIVYDVSGKMTIKEAGVYQVTANIALAVATGTLGPMQMWVGDSMSEPVTVIPGLNQGFPASNTPSSTNSQYVTTTATVFLAAGATVGVYVLSAVAQTILSGSYLSVVKVG